MLRTTLVQTASLGRRSLGGRQLLPARMTTLARAFDEKEARKWLQFTCTHKECKQEDEANRVVRKTISTTAYEKGVVLVRCPCDKLHLIADRLGWFEEGGTDIEKIAEASGIKFDKGILQYKPDTDALRSTKNEDAGKNGKH